MQTATGAMSTIGRVGGLAVCAWLVLGTAARAESPVAAENRLAGSTEWRLTRASSDLEAYANVTSVQHGDAFTIHARSGSSQQVSWKLFRMGHYGGAGGRLVASGGSATVGWQSTPSANSSTGLVECAWPATFRITTDPAWVSGVYLVVLTRADGIQTSVPVTVRADERKGIALYQTSVTTWQAYNEWGGESLYADSIGLVDGFAREVSFDRPYADGNGTGEFLRWEQPFVQWLESRGYDLGYVTNVDVDRDPSLLQGQKLFISGGHDEYWSRRARASLEAAIGNGTSFASLSADSIFWQIRIEANRRDGRPGRTVVCYKTRVAEEDPLAGTNLATWTWRDPHLNEPENALKGVMSANFQFTDQPWLVRNSSSWVYAGTGLRDGDSIPIAVGYESDRTFDNGRAPPGLTVLAHSPNAPNDGEASWHDATLYENGAGAFVFSSGSIVWGWLLGKPGYANAAAQKITDNLFARAGLTAGLSGATFGSDAVPTPDYTGAASSVVTLAGKAFTEGLVDGAAVNARFRRPMAAVVDRDGTIFVADTGNHAIRMIGTDANRTVTTIVGNGTKGRANGPGSSARLALPQGIAIASDGSLWVSDTGNQRIVRIARDGAWTVSHVAGATDGSLGYRDGSGSTARFFVPTGLVAVGSDMFLTDSRNSRIRKITAGGTVSTVAGGSTGANDGTGTGARFDRPYGLTAGSGALWVVDAKNRLIRRVSLDGTYAVTTIAGVTREGGFLDGAARSAKFMPQWGIAERSGTVYVADLGNSRIRRISSGTVRTYAGSGTAGSLDGTGPAARFSLPSAIVSLPDGRWLVLDSGASTLRVVSDGDPAPTPDPDPTPTPDPTPDPAPTTGTFTDDFDACTSTTNLGPNWAIDGRWYCASGRARGETAFGTALANFAATDVSMEARVLLTGTATASGVIVRGTTGAYYAGRILTSGRAQIVRMDAGGTTVLADAPASIAALTTYKLKLTATGSTAVALALTVNGTPVASASDASANRLLSGKVGLLSGSFSRTQFDDVVASGATTTTPTDPPPPPPPPPPPSTGTTFTDDFDACTSTTDLGSAWIISGRWYCASGRARGETALGTAVANFDAPVDVQAEALVLLTGDATGSGVVARAANGSFYAARLLATGRVQLVRVAAGNVTVLADVARSVTTLTSYRVALRAVGTSPVQLTLLVNGTVAATATDDSTARLQSGRAGLLSGSAARTQFDDVTIRAP